MRNELFNIVTRLSAFTLFFLVTSHFIVGWIRNRPGSILFDCLVILMSSIFSVIAFREDKTKTALFDIFTRLIACALLMAVFWLIDWHNPESVNCLGFVGAMLIFATGFSFIFTINEVEESDSDDKRELAILAAVYAYENNLVGQQFINLPFRGRYTKVEIWCNPDDNEHLLPDSGQIVKINKKN